MFCVTCGCDTGAITAFCPRCGASQSPQAQPPRAWRFTFHGDGSAYFVLSIKIFLLTLITLGVYWFWGKAERRRYLYSQTEFAGDRFAWHGTGLELLLGFVKAAAALAALIAIVVFFQVGVGGAAGEILGVLAVYTGVFALTPLAMIGTHRYRLSRTSWRGVRFAFDGSIGGMYKTYFAGLVLTLVTFGIYLPWWLNNLRAYLVRHSFFGTQRFGFDGEGADLLPAFLGSYFLALPTLTLSLLWFQAHRQLYYWTRTTITAARFGTTATALGVTGVVISNYLLTFITLGIYGPWADIRLARYICNNMSLYGSLDLAGIHQRAIAASATGEGLSSMLDLDATGFEL